MLIIQKKLHKKLCFNYFCVGGVFVINNQLNKITKRNSNTFWY